MPMDPTQLASGGFAGEGTITDAAFVYDERFTNDSGDPLCLLSFTLDPADGEHEPFTKFYQCGDGWEPADGGKRVVWAEDPDNDRKAFGSTSKVGRLITAIVKACPDVIADRYADGDGVGADSAAMFEGLRFVWADEVKVKNVRQPDGSWKPSTTGETTSLLLPVEFVEVVGGGAAKAKKAPTKKAAAAAVAEEAEAAPAKAPAKKAAKKKAPAPAAEPAAAEGGFPAELEDAAYAIYQEVDGDTAFDDWLNQVIALDGIEAHIDYVTEPEEGGLWDALTDRYEAED